MLSRRSFTAALGATAIGGAFALGAKAVAQAPRYVRSATFAGVRIGISSNGFGTVEQTLDLLQTVGVGAVELHPNSIEPNLAGRPGFRQPPAPGLEKVVEFNRVLTREWRLGVPLAIFSQAGDKFRAAGIEPVAWNQNYEDDFTDAEIERTFDMAQALGTDLITAVGPNDIFRRLDPFAKRRKIRVGIHNEPTIPDIATFESIVDGLSDYTGFNLDIGHFTASGGDTLGMLKKHHGRIFDVHLKDRKKNLGPQVPLGTGDAPLVEALQWIRDNNFKVPVNIEQSGVDRLTSARTSLEFCRKALLT